MTVLMALVGLVSLLSLAVMGSILYEYRRLIQKRAELWQTVDRPAYRPAGQTILTVLYIATTLLLVIASLFLL